MIILCLGQLLVELISGFLICNLKYVCVFLDSTKALILWIGNYLGPTSFNFVKENKIFAMIPVRNNLQVDKIHTVMRVAMKITVE